MSKKLSRKKLKAKKLRQKTNRIKNIERKHEIKFRKFSHILDGYVNPQWGTWFGNVTIGDKEAYPPKKFNYHRLIRDIVMPDDPKNMALRVMVEFLFRNNIPFGDLVMTYTKEKNRRRGILFRTFEI